MTPYTASRPSARRSFDSVSFSGRIATTMFAPFWTNAARGHPDLTEPGGIEDGLATFQVGDGGIDEKFPHSLDQLPPCTARYADNRILIRDRTLRAAESERPS